MEVACAGKHDAHGQYIPAPKDLVLGTIIHRHSEGYRVDLGSAQMASLDALAFEGATKRSKPNLKVSRSFWAFNIGYSADSLATGIYLEDTC
jgi:exosome complex RNA-binding protein Rrp4